MIIYKITFPNNKVYIGQTIRVLNERLKEHRRDSNDCNKNNYNCVLYRAIRKYGFNNLKFDIIDYANDVEELNEKEIHWIKYYNSYIHSENSNGYNSNFGGNSNLGHKPSASTKRKISEGGRGEKNSNAKLTSKDIEEIKILLNNKVKQVEIARMYKVSEAQISRIKNGTRWAS